MFGLKWLDGRAVLATGLFFFAGPSLAIAQVFTAVPAPPLAPHSGTTALAGAADITVLVLVDGTTPLGGATVTLQGTDAVSLPGLSGNTGANGAVTFVSVTGPYNVTAQADFTDSGSIYRLASSLIGVTPAVSGTPPAGAVGVFMGRDFSGSGLSTDATLSGKVSNMPYLGPGEYLIVGAHSRTGYFGSGGWVDPGTGAYSMPIPSGVTIDCYVVRMGPGSGSSDRVLATLLQPNVGQTTAGGTLVANFDFGSSQVVSWNLQTAFFYAYLHPGTTWFSIGLDIGDATSGAEYNFELSNGPSIPSSLWLPDLSSPALAAYEFRLEADAEAPQEDSWQFREKVLSSTPASVFFDFILPPRVVQPADLSTLTMAEFDALHVQVNESLTGPFGDNGLDFFDMWNDPTGGGTPPPGIDAARWSVFLPAGVTSFDLPPYALDMFAPTQMVRCAVVQWRNLGYSFDYDAFFSGNLAANFVALEALSLDECESREEAVRLFLYP